MRLNRNPQSTTAEPTGKRLAPRVILLFLAIGGIGAVLLWTGLHAPEPPIEAANANRPASVGEGPSESRTSKHELVADAKPGSENPPFPPPLPDWPSTPMDGEQAKKFLLETLTKLNESFSKIPGYTVTFRKQERLKGKLSAEQTFAMKVRQDPFAVYLKALAPTTGREIIFARGFFEDKVIAHSDGLSRWLVPKLQVPPEHPLVRSESRHPITNAGIGNLIRNLIGYRTRDLGHPDSETTLDQWTDSEGRRWLRSLHIHRTHTPERPFTRAEVLYHPETRLPLRFTGFDWPDSDAGSDAPILGERYCYDDLTLNAPLSGSDFDPANPSYHFHRF